MGRPDEGHGAGSGGPADVDWPRGYGEATWWPIVVVAGAVGIYAGAGLTVLARVDEPLVGSAVGPLAFLAGVGVFLLGLAGWTYHGFVARHGPWHPTDTSNRFRWGTGLFICVEAATFGAGFAYYGYVRAGPWPPGPLPDLLSSLVVVNTALLLASSVTLHVAHGALRAGRRRRFLGSLAATVLLGLVFLLGQAYEYYEFLHVEGFTPTGGVYASAFYGLTGLHGVHVALGASMLAVVLVRAGYGHYDADRHASVTAATLYWHFVDAVWLLLVAVLYVGAAVRF